MSERESFHAKSGPTKRYSQIVRDIKWVTWKHTYFKRCFATLCPVVGVVVGQVAHKSIYQPHSQRYNSPDWGGGQCMVAVYEGRRQTPCEGVVIDGFGWKPANAFLSIRTIYSWRQRRPTRRWRSVRQSVEDVKPRKGQRRVCGMRQIYANHLRVIHKTSQWVVLLHAPNIKGCVLLVWGFGMKRRPTKWLSANNKTGDNNSLTWNVEC